MTCTKEQIRNFMRYRKTFSFEVAAAKAGMSENTARKYLKQGGKKLPTPDRDYRTRRDPFVDVWSQLQEMLAQDDGLEAKTLMQWLLEQYPEKFRPTHLRTLQRRVCQWRALHGPEKDIFFPQDLKPGKQSQSDYTWCNELGITIAGEPFEHLLFHFMLPYSRWETASIAFSESFLTLTEGYAAAVKELGSVAPEHRTDNLAAAVPIGQRKVFQRRWKDFLSHYGVEPSANNPGQSNENGSVEKSHDLLKKALEQRLKLRGSRDFASRTAYEEFFQSVIYRRNKDRKERLAEELKLLQELPRRDWNAPQELFVSVRPWSTVSILRSLYSVPSRLVGAKLRALVYSDRIELYFGKNLVQQMVKVRPGENAINYRHVIASLLRKPGAFRNYKYRDELFPTMVFRRAFDCLEAAGKDDKEYLKILSAAAMDGESLVETALGLLLEMKQIPTEESVKALLVTKHDVPEVTILMPNLALYDGLLSEQLAGVNQ
ncbi:MAG: IS21 family transposase [Candidatus Obscuribacterales bacterium]|nr:IS21 family transposase [Candidatus Obscuribacterales bacterium]